MDKETQSAEGGSRTRTGLPPADFESAASSSSATSAIFTIYILIKFEILARPIILIENFQKIKIFIKG